MIQLNARITFFDITRCGYYPYGQSTPQFGSVDDVFTQLRKWSTGMELQQTKVLDTNDQDAEPVYLFGIEKGATGWVVSTWNEIPHSDAGVPSVSMKAKVGSAQVKMNAIDQFSIPGYPSYFWIIPGENVLATVRFEMSRSGQGGLVSYVSQFMAQFSSYVIKKVSGTDSTVVGYTDKGDGVPQQGVRPVFRTSVSQKPDRHKKLIANYARIRRVIRRGHVTTTNAVGRKAWQGAIAFIRGLSASTNAVGQRVMMEVDYRPTKAELEAMIEAEMNDPNTDGWDDMGFMLDKDPNPHWLGRERCRGEITLNVNIKNDTIELASLVKALEDKKKTILDFRK
ncbi:hypothetical protein [Massilia endophytica]|uniref:hypothetical protein n=1 Tax=Massilia endophytica TaxID=2899220 RepID=UPI001E47722D|nr:hypothetical protein [Massilia endophytica]UGQ45110.1 hypothetical protein LSQ66_15055 [Massilia endophytica]